MDPDTIQSLKTRIRMDLLPYCEGGSAGGSGSVGKLMVGSMIRTDPGSSFLGSDPGIRFRDPRTCLVLGTCQFIKF